MLKQEHREGLQAINRDYKATGFPFGIADVVWNKRREELQYIGKVEQIMVYDRWEDAVPLYSTALKYTLVSFDYKGEDMRGLPVLSPMEIMRECEFVSSGFDLIGDTILHCTLSSSHYGFTAYDRLERYMSPKLFTT